MKIQIGPSRGYAAVLRGHITSAEYVELLKREVDRRLMYDAHVRHKRASDEGKP